MSRFSTICLYMCVARIRERLFSGRRPGVTGPLLARKPSSESSRFVPVPVCLGGSSIPVRGVDCLGWGLISTGSKL